MAMTDLELHEYMAKLREPVSVELTREGWQLVKTALFNEAQREEKTARRCKHATSRDVHTRYAARLRELRGKVRAQADQEES